MWWDLKSGGKLTRMLLGSYEREQTAQFRRLVRAGDQVLDIGAASGYYTLLAARSVGPRGSVISFEPDLENLRVLCGHVLRNRLQQVQILPNALGDVDSVAAFGGGTGTGTRRLCDDGRKQVRVRRLDDVAAELELHPQHVKIDVEGHELAVLQGGRTLFATHRPTLFLSTHEWIRPGVHRACCDLLRQWGYQLQSLHGGSVENASELLCQRSAAQALSA
jgi:FkbM family methyltransferase